MERAVEWYLAITVSVVGVSHLVRPGDWAQAYRQLHASGHPGAFVNGWLNLVSGGLVVAGPGHIPPDRRRRETARVFIAPHRGEPGISARHE